MGSPLGILLSGLVGVSFIWEDVLCQNDEYTLHVPHDVSVQEGLCVVVPCNFTYKVLVLPTTDKLFGYWYEDGSIPVRDYPVASSDRTRDVKGYARNRFHLSENVEQGDCSLTITDAKKSDEKVYFFRIERGQLFNHQPFSYLKAPLSVTVTVRENPKIQVLGLLQAGYPADIVCTAPRSCPLKPPQITWRGISESATSGISGTLSNGSEVYSSVLNFTPSEEDDGRYISCRVDYGKGLNSVSIEETFQLNIRRGRVERSTIISLLCLFLIKIFDSFFFFFYGVWFANRRKAALVQEGVSK